MNIYTHMDSPIGRLLLQSDGVALTGLYMDVLGQRCVGMDVPEVDVPDADAPRMDIDRPGMGMPGKSVPGQGASDQSVSRRAVSGQPVPARSSDAEPWIEDAVGGPLPQTIRQLGEYFAGKRREFDLPLRLEGTSFQRRVWQVLMEIPFGETWSYGQLAKRIDNPNASRAVGLANGRNPVSILVPCHRVIGANGSLTGYGGGVDRKRWLLAHEGLH